MRSAATTSSSSNVRPSSANRAHPALIDNGIEVPYSCTEGVCGTCETRVIEGIPDHRDSILTEAEQKANKSMMICCSGCKSEKLVLDL